MQNEHQEDSWWQIQFLRIKYFADIVVALALDAALIVIIWSLRKVVIRIIGVDPATIDDRTLFFIVRASELGTISGMAIYIVCDIIRQFIKAYVELKESISKTIFSRSIKAD